MLDKKNICPYCNISLEKIPSKKTKCKNCKNDIYVKKHPDSSENILVTKEQADKIGKEWKLYYFIKKWKQIIFDQYKFPKNEYEKIKKISGSPFEKDHLFSSLNKLVEIFSIKKEYQKVSQIFYSMALFVAEEGRSDYFQLLQQSRKYELLENIELEKKGIKVKVRILTAGENNSCQECLKQDKRLYTIDEALKTMPIPNQNCTHIMFNYPFCRCIWTTEVIV